MSDGYYSYAKLTELSGLSSSKAETLRKVMWVSYNAPGYKSSYWPSLGSISDKYVLAHLLVSYVYGGADAAAYKSGVNSSTLESWAEDILDSIADVEVSDGFNAYVIANAGSYCQYIIFWTYPVVYLTVEKSSTNTSITDGNGCYSLKGIQYQVYTDKSCSTKAKDTDGNNALLTLKADGTANTLELAPDKYYIREVKSSTETSGYAYDDTVYPMDMTSSSSTESKPDLLSVEDEPVNDPAGITLYKLDSETGEPYAQGDADLSDAQFTVEYYDGYYKTEAELPSSPKRTWVIKTKYVDGEYIARLTDDYKVSGDNFYYKDSIVVLPLGTYVIYETKAPEGYLIEGTFVDGDGTSVQAGEKFIAVLEHEGDAVWIEGGNVYDGNDDVIRGGVEVQKRDEDTLGTEPQGDATLSGATFEIVNASADAVMVDGDGDGELEEFTPGAVVLTLTTDEDGHAETADDALPYGSYIIRETGAPTGYLGEGVTERTFEIREDGVIVDMTDRDHAVINPVIRGGVEVQKRDVESLRDDPQGAGSFKGITLEITNTGDHFVMVDSDGDGELERFEPGEVVLTLTTDGNGYAATAADALPYGSYTIAETAVPGDEGHRVVVGKETDDGYLMGSDDNAAYTANLSIDFTIRKDGVIVNLTGDTTENGESAVSAENAITDQVKRGDITLVKHDADTDESMSVPFMVTSLTTGESHVFWTDKNGDYSSDSTWNAHSYKTDAGEDYSDGLWFYGYPDWESFVTYGDDGYMTDNGYVDDNVGALPYDSYRLDELRCEANEGKVLEHTTFTIDQDVRVVNLGQYDNEDAPFVHTNAWASDTGTQVCYVGGDNGDGWVTLYDDVHYYNLTPGQTYGIYGVALDADTREPEYDHYGNEICAWTLFTADGTGSGMEIQEFYFDVEDLSGHRVVFFETIFAVDADGNVLYDDDEDNEYYPYQFYVAEDPDDYLAQTIYFPQVGTELTDSETGEHFSVTDGTVTLTDHVAVTEVPEGETVTIYGELHDKATGEAIIDADGNTVTASGTFTSPGLDTWYADLTFTFDASALSGNGAVAFESLYQVVDDTEILVGSHADLDDEDQTAYFPGIWTTAVDSETQSHISFADGEVTVIDTVEYRNLIAGQTYTMKGVLMDKDIGEPLLDDDGNEITAEVTFVAGESGETADVTDAGITGDTEDSEAAEAGDTDENDADGTAVNGLVDGSVEMVFTFPAGTLAGKAAVAFEQLYIDDTLVTEHTDIDDEDQTVWFPEIRTHAYGGSTGAHLEEASDTVTIIDAVEYHGLIAGETYVMTGTLHDKETGEALDAEGATASVEFTPEESDGWVYLTFTIDGSDLAGHALVAFEECTLNDIPVATHEDLTDEEQTVWIPAISTTATDAADGDGTVLAGLISVNDRVDYTGLEAGRQYVMAGTLMDQATGEAVLVNGEAVTEELAFVPEESDGSVTLTVSADIAGLGIDALVMFEKCYLVDDDGGRTEVAAHEDINDEAQTVTVMNPAISTTATDAADGDGRVNAGAVTVNDRVDYTGLEAGRQYVMAGTLMDQATGEAVLVNGEAATAELTFTPEESDGYVTVTVSADATGMEGGSLVMFEKCYLVDDDGGRTEVAAHEDINDKAQTVKVRNRSGGTDTTGARTGLMNFGFIAVIGAAALAVALVLIRRRRMA